MAACCETCPMWVRAGEKTGNCHAHPPVPIITPTQRKNLISGETEIVPMLTAYFPPANPDAWCGEHPLFAATTPIDRRLMAEVEGRG